MNRWKIILAVVASLWVLTPLSAQDAPAVITAENITRLASVAHIDFDNAPAEAGKIDNGWFALSSTGERFATMNRSNELVIWTSDGKIIDHYSIPGSDNLPTTILDADFNADGTLLASAHTEGGIYYVAYRSIDATHTEYFRFETQDVPLRIWADKQVWLEISSADSSLSRYVLQLNPIPLDRFRQNDILSDSELHKLASGPENDADSFLRIGRIDPPLAITATQSNVVKRWNLETGEVTATAQVGKLPGAGQVNADGRYFAWRDGDSKALHLLDFETGKDRVVADLGGTYLPFMLLTPDADVIIAVNAGLKPVVTAWNTANGERYDLGEYRACTRQPDMVRLSEDGTTLAIGCDTGLDIWQIRGKNS